MVSTSSATAVNPSGVRCSGETLTMSKLVTVPWVCGWKLVVVKPARDVASLRRDARTCRE
jgi:hypothetical protein